MDNLAHCWNLSIFVWICGNPMPKITIKITTMFLQSKGLQECVCVCMKSLLRTSTSIYFRLANQCPVLRQEMYRQMRGFSFVNQHLKYQLCTTNNIHFRPINGCSSESVKYIETEYICMSIYMQIYIYIYNKEVCMKCAIYVKLRMLCNCL